MEIILKQDLKNLGYKNDIVKVRNGYGRNFLLPRGYAILADVSSRKVLAETKKQQSFKEEKVKTAAQTTANALKDMIVKVGAKAGENGKIFGSVNVIQIVEAIKKLGYDIDRKNIHINDDAVKTLGSYTADVKFHKEITGKITFEVIAE